MSSHAEIDLAFPAEPQSAPQFRSALRAFLEGALVEREKINDVVLAAGEAAGNAIEHAYRGESGTFRLKAILLGDRLVVEVWDKGRWRLDGDPERGRGLGIMRALVDDVAIESTRSGTSVRLVLALV